jgi:aspartokinase/homoserine dehydrogenase 1
VVDPVLPARFELSGTPAEFLGRLPTVNAYFNETVRKAGEEGKCLRFSLAIKEGKWALRVAALGLAHPADGVCGAESHFASATERYKKAPLIIRGEAAGAVLTASGVFANVQRLASWNSIPGGQ